MALAYAGINFQIREVVLKHKPQQLLDASRKATVPVLVREDGVILEESLDIVDWSLAEYDPDGWKAFPAEKLVSMTALIGENDSIFKDHLDHYKYSDRYSESSKIDYRRQGEVFLVKLEGLLVLSSFMGGKSAFLFADRISVADIAIFPFIRQFANVEPAWFKTAPYPRLKQWLTCLLDSELFTSVMKKYPAWKPGDSVVHFIN